MYLEKEALDYFRKYDLLNSFLLPFLSGQYGEIYSRKIGRNLEFEQYREYTPGDNLKDIDWKVYARSDKLFIRNYGSDINTRVRIIIDNSRSMDYPDSPVSKLETAKKITAIFSSLLIREKNTVSLSIINNDYNDYGRIYLSDLENILSGITPSGQTWLNKIVPPKSREMIFLLSDGWWGDEDLDNQLQFLIKNHINWVHLLSADEIHFPLTGNLEISDSETGEKLNLIASAVRQSYSKKMKERLQSAGRKMMEAGLLYSAFQLDKKYYVSLKDFFEKAKGRRRGKRS
jgi:uncharacterized protein (DUF58 family)